MTTSISSSQLQQLYHAVGTTDDLFPALERTRGFRAWVVVLACLPALFAYQHATFTELDAEWALRSMDLLHAETAEGIVCPGGDDSPPEIRYQPPMGSWLNALGIRLLPGHPRTEVLVSSWLGTAALIGGCFWFIRDLFGERIALWSVVLISGQIVVIRQAQTPIPHAWSVFTGLLSVRALRLHLLRERTIISWQILGGGLALGLCLLFGGPVAIPFLLLQAAYCVTYSLGGREAARGTVSMVPPGRRFLALGLMWATCCAVAGWWPMMMGSAYGAEFWGHWFFGGLGDRAGFPLDRAAAGEFLAEFGPLAGLAIYGLVSGIRSQVRDHSFPHRELLVWMVTAGVWWLLSGLISVDAGLLPEASRLLFQVALTVYAAVAVDAVSRGRLSLVPALLLTMAPLALVLVDRMLLEPEWQAEEHATDTAIAVSLGVFVLFLAIRLLYRRQLAQPAWTPLTVGLFLLGLVVANYHIAFADHTPGPPGATTQTIDGMSWSRLRRALRGAPEEVQSFIVLSQERDTARLRLELTLMHPEATLELVDSWPATVARLRELAGQGPVVIVEQGAFAERPARLVFAGWQRQPLGRNSEQISRNVSVHLYVPSLPPE